MFDNTHYTTDTPGNKNMPSCKGNRLPVCFLDNFGHWQDKWEIRQKDHHRW